MFRILQPGVQTVNRLRAPLATDSATVAARSLLVQGDWLAPDANGRFAVLGTTPVRAAFPITTEPQQTDTLMTTANTGTLGERTQSGLTLANGRYVAESNRFDTVNMTSSAVVNQKLLVAKKINVGTTQAPVYVYGLALADVANATLALNEEQFAVGVGICLVENNTVLRFLAL